MSVSLAPSPRLVRTIVPVLPTATPPAGRRSHNQHVRHTFVPQDCRSRCSPCERLICAATSRRRHVRQVRHHFVAKTGRDFFDEAHFATYIHGGRPYCVLPQPICCRARSRSARPGTSRRPQTLTPTERCDVNPGLPPSLDRSHLLVALASLVAPAAAQSFSTSSSEQVSSAADQVSAAAAVARPKRSAA